MNSVKVYGIPRDNPAQYGLAEYQESVNTALSLDRWWQNIFAGCAGTRFHRPEHGIGLNATAQKHIHAARVFTSAFNIFTCEPMPELLMDREDNEAYCLADLQYTYAIYFHTGGQVRLLAKGNDYTLHWFGIDAGKSQAPVVISRREYGTGGTAAAPGNPALDENRGGHSMTIPLKKSSTEKMWLALVQGR